VLKIGQEEKYPKEKDNSSLKLTAGIKDWPSKHPFIIAKEKEEAYLAGKGNKEAGIVGGQVFIKNWTSPGNTEKRRHLGR